MKIFVAVNQVDEVGYRQTTALLVAAFVRFGHEVSLVGVSDFSVDSSVGPISKFVAECRRLPPSDNCDSGVVADFSKSDLAPTLQPIEPGDMILIRTNPGRDTQRAAIHDAFLDFCRVAQTHGICVLNDPSHLKYFASKASLAAVDSEFCPPLIVSNRSDMIADFVRRSETTCIIKPVIGSRGQNIIRVRHDDEGLESLIESKFESVGIVAQHFVNSDPVADKRVVVLCGKVLEVDGQLAGIERRPAQGDFRANLHAGGTALPLTLSKSERAAAEYAAILLFRHGVSLAGVDLIGDKIIEFNVFSTGGLFDAESYSGVSFSDAIARRICD